MTVPVERREKERRLPNWKRGDKTERRSYGENQRRQPPREGVTISAAEIKAIAEREDYSGFSWKSKFVTLSVEERDALCDLALRALEGPSAPQPPEAARIIEYVHQSCINAAIDAHNDRRDPVDALRALDFTDLGKTKRNPEAADLFPLPFEPMKRDERTERGEWTKS